MTTRLDARARRAADAARASAATHDLDAILLDIQEGPTMRTTTTTITKRRATMVAAAAAITVLAMIVGSRILTDAAPDVPDVVRTPEDGAPDTAPDTTPDDTTNEDATPDTQGGAETTGLAEPINVSAGETLLVGQAIGLSPDGTHAYVLVDDTDAQPCGEDVGTRVELVEISSGARADLGLELTEARIVHRAGQALVLDGCEQDLRRILTATITPDGRVDDVQDAAIPFEADALDGPSDPYTATLSADGSEVLLVESAGDADAVLVAIDPRTGERRALRAWPRANAVGELTPGTYAVLDNTGVTIFDEASTIASFEGRWKEIAISGAGDLAMATDWLTAEVKVAIVRDGELIPIDDRDASSLAWSADGSVLAYGAGTGALSGPGNIRDYAVVAHLGTDITRYDILEGERSPVLPGAGGVVLSHWEEPFHVEGGETRVERPSNYRVLRTELTLPDD